MMQLCQQQWIANLFLLGPLCPDTVKPGFINPFSWDSVSIELDFQLTGFIVTIFIKKKWILEQTE